MNPVSVNHLYRKTFLIALASAALIFLPAMIMDKGYFLFVGDFNSQQIPFYMNVHDSIRNGEWGWNWYTDLGANMIGSYSFYNLGSPFFWLTLLLPSNFVAYTLGPLLMLKFALAAVTSCLYLRKYVKNELFALLGGLLYAFSGFSIYNIFFNHFHEVIVFFPLMLYAMDEWMEKGTRGLFALTVCLNALVNYFFFFGEVIFVMIYYFVRLIFKSYERSFRKFWGIFLEAVIGFVMSMILMLPSALSVLQNSRLSHILSGTSFWFYGSKERVPSILLSFLFPPELPSKQILLPDANTKWTSLSAFLPISGCTGAIVFVQKKRHDWLTKLLTVLLVMALIPGLNGTFVALNSSYYARWFYMLTLMLILATIRTFDRGWEKSVRRVNWKLMAIMLVIIAALGLTPTLSDGKITRIGIFDKDWPEYFITVAGSALVSTMVFAVLNLDLKEKPKTFAKEMVIAVCIFSVLYGNFFVFWGKSRSYETKEYLIPDAIEGEEKITIPDKNEVIRIDTDDSLINMGMFWKVSCMRAFHSIVPGSIMDFYQYLGEERSVSSKIPEAQYAVRGLLSVHWYFDRIDYSSDFGGMDGEDTLMPGYTYYDEMAGYRVYENDFYVPMGFTYDEYVLMDDLDNISDGSKAATMLHAVALDEEQAARLQGVLSPMDMSPTGEEAFVPDKSHYFEDCLRHKQNTVDDLKKTKKGITCRSSFDEEEFVFFSIPWDEGWSCLIDGKETDIEKVNVGFMGILVPSGSHEIEFIYQTPGLRSGIFLSIGGLIMLCVYMILTKKKDHQREVAMVQMAAETALEEETDLAEAAAAAEQEMPSEETEPSEETMNEETLE